jgi:hypothetical protein
LEREKDKLLVGAPVWRACVTALLDKDLPLVFLAPLVAAVPFVPFMVETQFPIVRQNTIPVQDPDEVFHDAFTPFMDASPALAQVLKGQFEPSKEC